MTNGNNQIRKIGIFFLLLLFASASSAWASENCNMNEVLKVKTDPSDGECRVSFDVKESDEKIKRVIVRIACGKMTFYSEEVVLSGKNFSTMSIDYFSGTDMISRHYEENYFTHKLVSSKYDRRGNLLYSITSDFAGKDALKKIIRDCLKKNSSKVKNIEFFGIFRADDFSIYKIEYFKNGIIDVVDYAWDKEGMIVLVREYFKNGKIDTVANLYKTEIEVKEDGLTNTYMYDE